MAVTIDDVVEAATNGVLRALDARKAAHERAAAHPEDPSATAMVRSGFYVDLHIRCGGFPPFPVPEGPPPLGPGGQRPGGHTQQ
jgi:hypothetical protein